MRILHAEFMQTGSIPREILQHLKNLITYKPLWKRMFTQTARFLNQAGRPFSLAAAKGFQEVE